MTELFRPEALEAFSRRYGSIVKFGASGYWIWVAALFVLVLTASCAAMFYPYPRWEVARGITVFEIPPTLVITPYRALVSRVFVHDGDHVRRGQPLVELQAPVASDGAVDPITRQRANLLSILESREEADSALEKQHAETLQALDKQQRWTRVQIDSTRADLANQGADTARLTEFLQLLKSKDGNLDAIPRVQVLDYEARLVAAKAIESGLNQKLAQLEAESVRLHDDEAKEKTQLKVVREEFKGFKAQHEADRLGNVMETGGILYAPADGIVANVAVAERNMAKAESALMSILPMDSAVAGVVSASADQASFLKVGSEVRLRFNAYEYRTRGEVIGKVTEISSAPIFADIAEALGGGSEEPKYRVRVSIPAESFRQLDRSARLVAGMGFDGVIIKNREPLLGKLFRIRPTEPTGKRP